MMSLPMFNYTYADADNIYYLYNALLPLRAEGYDWERHLPGDTSVAADPESRLRLPAELQQHFLSDYRRPREPPARRLFADLRDPHPYDESRWVVDRTPCGRSLATSPTEPPWEKG
jgi:hypothetical protein